MNVVGGPVIEVVSGLTCPSVAEELLLKALGADVCISLYDRLTADAFGHCRRDIPLLLLLPVLGDNDLRTAHFAALATLSSNAVFATKKILIVLHGDRHRWDTPGDSDPVSAKLRNALYFSADFYLHPDKLDPDTAAPVASSIVAHLRTVRASYLADLATAAMALGERPSWDAERQKLDFYDPMTGFSRLYGKAPPVAARILERVSRMPVCTLLLNNAALEGAGLPDVPLSARRVDLGGNRLDFARALRAFPQVEWFGMAANELVQADLAKCPATLDHLYLHKNAIEHLHFPSGLHCKFKELSLYRNRLDAVSFPDDQAELLKVNLGANPITSVPDGLRNARGLRFLGLARTKITSLPPWLREMHDLRQVDISYIEHQLPARDLEELAERGIELIRKPDSHS